MQLVIKIVRIAATSATWTRRKRKRAVVRAAREGRNQSWRGFALSRQLNEDNGSGNNGRGESFRGRGRATQIVWLSAAMRPTYRSATPSTVHRHPRCLANANNSAETYVFLCFFSFFSPRRTPPRISHSEARIFGKGRLNASRLKRTTKKG